ncbi:CBS domain-containing protein [Poriferisphaera sp. WC338]|uniref:CBS domain-containing protein n=1 Tax=Poriferisphaera sp. WC338 TaxID=3425129 RepID=UPI003D817B72
MATVNQILADKGDRVWVVDREATVLDAAKMMNEQKVGALVITDEHHVVLGIFSERDVLRRVVAKGIDPGVVKVGHVMTDEVICTKGKTDLEEARGICMSRRVRHLPVVDDEGKLQGLISIGDLNAWDLSGHKRTIHYLHEYLYGT